MSQEFSTLTTIRNESKQTQQILNLERFGLLPENVQNTVNEAREALAYAPLDGQDDIRAPANIAGSAVNPDLGGRPESEETPEDA